jgi:hypothetical protein
VSSALADQNFEHAGSAGAFILGELFQQILRIFGEAETGGELFGHCVNYSAFSATAQAAIIRRHRT